MITATVTVTKNVIRRKMRGVKAASDEAVDLAASAMLDEALRRVRVGATRKLRDGLRIRILTAGEVVTTKAVGVWGVKEAGWNERGTVHMHAQPYLRPASLLGRRLLKVEAERKIRAEADSAT